MSKRDLKKYLTELNKEQLKEQIIDLYARFKEVKEYYDFVFNPQEQKLVDECKFKISKEYFPSNGRKAKEKRYGEDCSGLDCACRKGAFPTKQTGKINKGHPFDKCR